MKLDNSDYITALASYATALNRFAIHQGTLYVLMDAEVSIRQSIKPFVADSADLASWYSLARDVQACILEQIEGDHHE